MKILLLATAMAALLNAQTIKLPVNIESLSHLATETVDVTMDTAMIRFAEKFLSEKDPGQAKAKRVLRGLNSIYVKTFEFAGAGAYSIRDLEPLRQQLRKPDWSRMIQSREDDEHVEVYARMQGGEMSGLLVVSAEPRELTIVHLDGAVRPEDLASLGGHVGLPKMRIGGIR
jgi:hypothetical protein